MKKLDDLQSAMDFIYNKHRGINSPARGVNGYKMLRRPNGSRYVFECIKGFRIFRHFVFPQDPRCLTLETMGTGITQKGETKITVTCHLYLSELSVINIYDHRCEFLSNGSIDFAYIENEYSAELSVASEFMFNEEGILRAQWTSQDESAAVLLKEISVSRTMKLATPRRYIDISEEDDS